MHLARRYFLRLSAVGTASVVLPFVGTGCAGPREPATLQVGERDAFPYFNLQGNLLELQPDRHRVLVRGPGGAEVATLGGFGQGAGELNGPADLTLGPDGRVYVVDRGNSRIQVYRQDGTHVGQVGRPGKEHGQLLRPSGICMDAAGRLLVSDSVNHRVQAFSPEGTWLGTFGEGELQLPRGIAVGPDGRIHVVDSAHARVVVYDAQGRNEGHYGHYGKDGAGMVWPRDIAVDADGSVYVADVTCNAVHRFDVDGTFLGRISLQRESGPVAPVHLALSPAGELRVAARAGTPD